MDRPGSLSHETKKKSHHRAQFYISLESSASDLARNVGGMNVFHSVVFGTAFVWICSDIMSLELLKTLGCRNYAYPTLSDAYKKDGSPAPTLQLPTAGHMSTQMQPQFKPVKGVL